MVQLLLNPIFLVFACITITSLSATIAHYWWKMRHDELEIALKQDMVQQGMSADDIVKVLKASSSKCGKSKSAYKTREAVSGCEA